jgi:hypothetical protein
MAQKYSKTFPSLLNEAGITEEEGLALINEALDQIDFCAIVNKRYGINLTLKQVEEIYETCPTYN